MRIILLLLFICFPILVFTQDSIWLGKTTGKLPFLEYGIGDDRLGGAKMGYLDSNIQLKIIDSFNVDYKVRLSANHTAYIPKESVVLIRKERNRKIVHNPDLSGSFKVFGDADYDYVMVNLPAPMPYRSLQLIEPSRIVVDIFGVTSNTNWISQLKSVKEIRNTWYEQTEDDVFRVFIELKHSQHWGYKIDYDSTGKTGCAREASTNGTGYPKIIHRH